jgi:hypothetical protein
MKTVPAKFQLANVEIESQVVTVQPQAFAQVQLMYRVARVTGIQMHAESA